MSWQRHEDIVGYAIAQYARKRGFHPEKDRAEAVAWFLSELREYSEEHGLNYAALLHRADEVSY